ncbi:hypothetical protein JYT31_01825, partial [Beggiatoa alba]|nr:hypothetical protein [Beggiatoa alba]
MSADIENKISALIDKGLEKQFSDTWSGELPGKLPEKLLQQCKVQWQNFLENTDENFFSGSWDENLINSLPKVWICSEVVARWCIHYPEWLQHLNKTTISDNRLDHNAYKMLWDHKSTILADEKDLFKKLRQFRNQQMLRIIWRDIAGWSELNNTTQELSALAEVCINGARDYYTQPDSDFTKEWGIPFNDKNEQQELIVIAMGKLGAWELNVSSDIDLIFAYKEDGSTKRGKKKIENSTYFVQLGKKVFAALNNITEDGFVFRVDMRLRPFGDGGVLASSFNTLENYYQIHGREWERYAMIKARVVSGDNNTAVELMQMLRPFVYRRYMDYGAYESMREIKTMIVQQVKRKGMQTNVKLGSGGIREVEF